MSRRVLHCGFIPLVDSAPLVIAREIGFDNRFQLNRPSGEAGVWTLSRDSMSNDSADPTSEPRGPSRRAVRGERERPDRQEDDVHPDQAAERPGQRGDDQPIDEELEGEGPEWKKAAGSLADLLSS